MGPWQVIAREERCKECSVRSAWSTEIKICSIPLKEIDLDMSRKGIHLLIHNAFSIQYNTTKAYYGFRSWPYLKSN